MQLSQIVKSSAHTNFVDRLYYRWSAIASRLPGRTDNEIKNYWNTHIRKRLLRMGIDPVTHSPRLDLLDLSSILCSSLYGNSSSQMNNFQTLLGMQQPLVNPELLKLASSLFHTSSHHQHQQDYNNNNQPCNPQIHNQVPLSHFVQFQDQVPQVNTNVSTNDCTTTFTTPWVSSLPNDSHLFEPNVDTYTSNFTDLSNYQQHFVHDIDWHQNNGFGLSTLKEEDYVPQTSSYNNYYGSDNQNLMYYQTSNQVLSTPSSSSPTPLNSNSTCIIGSNTEDERESYESCNRLNFEFPAHILEANDFM